MHWIFRCAAVDIIFLYNCIHEIFIECFQGISGFAMHHNNGSAIIHSPLIHSLLTRQTIARRVSFTTKWPIQQKVKSTKNWSLNYHLDCNWKPTCGFLERGQIIKARSLQFVYIHGHGLVVERTIRRQEFLFNWMAILTWGVRPVPFLCWPNPYLKRIITSCNITREE